MHWHHTVVTAMVMMVTVPWLNVFDSVQWLFYMCKRKAETAAFALHTSQDPSM